MNSKDEELFLAYKSLPVEEIPLAELESRIVTTLRKDGLIGQTSSRVSLVKLAAAIAACAVLFVSGILFEKHRTTSENVSMSEKTFALFLMEDENYKNPQNETEMLERIELYRNWGKQLREKGIVLNGTKLQDERHLLNISGEDPAVKTLAIAGYYLVDATNFNKALEIARTCPHLRFGGKIEIRQIHPV